MTSTVRFQGWTRQTCSEAHAALADASFTARRTLLEVTHVSGEPSWRCGTDPPPPHGIYYHSTYRIDGKTAKICGVTSTLAPFEIYPIRSGAGDFGQAHDVNTYGVIRL